MANIVRFCAAVAAARTGVQIHAYCVMSSHIHLIVTDVDGRLPEFAAWLNEFVAKCLNADQGLWEGFWSNDHYSAVQLETADDVWAKLCYVLANPVSSWLVEAPEQWPGAMSKPDEFGTSTTIERPPVFFRKKGKTPATAELAITRPPLLGDLTDAEASRSLMERLKARTAELVEEAKAAGRRFLGVAAVLLQSPTDAPTTHEPRRGLNPTLAAKDKDVRLAAIERLKQFRADYRTALASWRKGERLIEFPHGTYWLRLFAGARCREAA